MGEKRRNNSDVVAAKKRHVRFNIIDVLIILALLLIAAIVVNMFVPLSFFGKFNKTVERQIQYTVEITAVDESFIDNVTENQTVIDAVSKYEIGRVMTVDCNNHYSELKYNESESSGWLSPYSDKYNMLVTITVLAEYTEGEGYSVGDRRIAVGEKMSLRFPSFTAEGYCIALSND